MVDCTHRWDLSVAPYYCCVTCGILGSRKKDGRIRPLAKRAKSTNYTRKPKASGDSYRGFNPSKFDVD